MNFNTAVENFDRLAQANHAWDKTINENGELADRTGVNWVVSGFVHLILNSWPVRVFRGDDDAKHFQRLQQRLIGRLEEAVPQARATLESRITGNLAKEGSQAPWQTQAIAIRKAVHFVQLKVEADNRITNAEKVIGSLLSRVEIMEKGEEQELISQIQIVMAQTKDAVPHVLKVEDQATARPLKERADVVNQKAQALLKIAEDLSKVRELAARPSGEGYPNDIKRELEQLMQGKTFHGRLAVEIDALKAQLVEAFVGLEVDPLKQRLEQQKSRLDVTKPVDAVDIHRELNSLDQQRGVIKTKWEGQQRSLIDQEVQKRVLSELTQLHKETELVRGDAREIALVQYHQKQLDEQGTIAESVERLKQVQQAFSELGKSQFKQALGSAIQGAQARLAEAWKVQFQGIKMVENRDGSHKVSESIIANLKKVSALIEQWDATKEVFKETQQGQDISTLAKGTLEQILAQLEDNAGKVLEGISIKTEAAIIKSKQQLLPDLVGDVRKLMASIATMPLSVQEVVKQKIGALEGRVKTAQSRLKSTIEAQAQIVRLNKQQLHQFAQEVANIKKGTISEEFSAAIVEIQQRRADQWCDQVSALTQSLSENPTSKEIVPLLGQLLTLDKQRKQSSSAFDGIGQSHQDKMNKMLEETDKTLKEALARSIEREVGLIEAFSLVNTSRFKASKDLDESRTRLKALEDRRIEIDRLKKLASEQPNIIERLIIPEQSLKNHWVALEAECQLLRLENSQIDKSTAKHLAASIASLQKHLQRRSHAEILKAMPGFDTDAFASRLEKLREMPSGWNQVLRVLVLLLAARSR